MTFDEKVKFLRTLPQFKVIPLSEVRAVAFAVKEKGEPGSTVLKNSSTTLFLDPEDASKIVREYPDLASNLTPKT